MARPVLRALPGRRVIKAFKAFKATPDLPVRLDRRALLELRAPRDR